LIVPIALEYAFWDERLPEAMVRIGEPIELSATTVATSTQWQSELEQRLSSTMAELAKDVRGRDGARFEVLLAGRAGVGWFYDTWRRLRAALTGKPFVAEHGRRSR
jgi:hypothetical protein